MNYKCPNIECVLGRVPDRKSINGLAFCPICHGKGYIPESLPIPNEEKVVASDVGMTRPGHWRPASGIGAISGIPSFAGKAIATDGCLVVIERVDGQRVIGHMDSFVVAKQAKQRGKKEKNDINEGLFE